jgi:hypothetical protein
VHGGCSEHDMGHMRRVEGASEDPYASLLASHFVTLDDVSEKVSNNTAKSLVFHGTACIVCSWALGGLSEHIAQKSGPDNNPAESFSTFRPKDLSSPCRRDHRKAVMAAHRRLGILTA